MKRILLLLGVVVLASHGLHGQDAPLFTQKLTNSFLYNPSVAGNTFGSITLSHRKFWSSVQGSPTTNFFSAHTPFGQHRFGTGLNFYQDKVGVTQATYASGAFAYHLKLTDTKLLSFGVSGEYNSLKVNMNQVDVEDQDDPLLNGPARNGFDFNFGMSFKAQYFKLGVAANRLTGLTGIQDSTDQFPSFYSGFFQLMIPLAGERDLLEPVITVRSFTQGSPQIDGGLYYTFNDMFTLGGGYRTGGAINAAAAFRWKNVMLGYSRDILTGDTRQALGATNEFTLRFDFYDESYYLKQKNARAINTRAMTIRRKTLSTYNHRGGSSFQKNARYKKKLKKKSFMSPNYRMNASKKLMTQKRKSTYRRRR